MNKTNDNEDDQDQVRVANGVDSPELSNLLRVKKLDPENRDLDDELQRRIRTIYRIDANPRAAAAASERRKSNTDDNDSGPAKKKSSWWDIPLLGDPLD